MLITETSRVTTLGLALLFAIGMVSSGFASQGGFTTIDVPGAVRTEVYGINAQGDIVGNSDNGDTGGNFLLSKGVFTAIDAPGAVSAININGDLVGTYVTRLPTPKVDGYLLSKGNLTTIDVPGASATLATFRLKIDRASAMDS